MKAGSAGGVGKPFVQGPSGCGARVCFHPEMDAPRGREGIDLVRECCCLVAEEGMDRHSGALGTYVLRVRGILSNLEGGSGISSEDDGSQYTDNCTCAELAFLDTSVPTN